MRFLPNYSLSSANDYHFGNFVKYTVTLWTWNGDETLPPVLATKTGIDGYNYFSAIPKQALGYLTGATFCAIIILLW